MRPRHVWLALSVCIALCPRVHAQTPEQVRSCILAANECQEDRDEGRLLQAREKMVTCASDMCPAKLRNDCGSWLAELDQRLPSIVVRVVDDAERDVTDAVVQLDGTPIVLDGRAVPLDPGKHRLAVQAQSAEPSEQVFLAVEREVARVVRIRVQHVQPVGAQELPPPAASAPPPPPAAAPGLRVPTGAWIVGAAGVLAISSFTYFAVSAASERDSLTDSCAPVCSDDELRPARTRATLADISLATGLAALAGSVLWTVLAQGDRTPERVSATLVPRRGGAFGTLTTRF